MSRRRPYIVDEIGHDRYPWGNVVAWEEHLRCADGGSAKNDGDSDGYRSAKDSFVSA